MDKVPADEAEPDARFTFANERTSLAWSRTALALVTAGRAIAQLLWGPFRGRRRHRGPEGGTTRIGYETDR